MRVCEYVEAWGHANITAKNRRTFEITKENHLTKRGDCIIAVRASKSARGLSDDFKKAAQSSTARIEIIIRSGDQRVSVKGWGDPNLTFDHETDLVARTSRYTCGRTVMIRADHAASDFTREFGQALCDPHRKVKITLGVED
jgi:hypothetical protein